MKKLTHGHVKSEFKKRGCELLADEYVNNETPMPYVCECGNYSRISWANFRKGQRCCERCDDIIDVELHHTLEIQSHGEAAVNSAGHILLCAGCHVGLHAGC